MKNKTCLSPLPISNLPMRNDSLCTLLEIHPLSYNKAGYAQCTCPFCTGRRLSLEMSVWERAIPLAICSEAFVNGLYCKKLGRRKKDEEVFGQDRLSGKSKGHMNEADLSRNIASGYCLNLSFFVSCSWSHILVMFAMLNDPRRIQARF